jgi:hypothetical protein
MTQQQFASLTLAEKIDILRNADYVDTAEYYGLTVHLYSMKNGSFCEMFCEGKEEKVIKIEICDDNDLKKYLSLLD